MNKKLKLKVLSDIKNGDKYIVIVLNKTRLRFVSFKYKKDAKCFAKAKLLEKHLLVCMKELTYQTSNKLNN